MVDHWQLYIRFSKLPENSNIAKKPGVRRDRSLQAGGTGDQAECRNSHLWSCWVPCRNAAVLSLLSRRRITTPNIEPPCTWFPYLNSTWTWMLRLSIWFELLLNLFCSNVAQWRREGSNSCCRMLTLFIWKSSVAVYFFNPMPVRSKERSKWIWRMRESEYVCVCVCVNEWMNEVLVSII